MLSSVLRTVRAHGLVAAGDRVLVAVSGGPDSMALLHALWELAARLGVTLEVATVDHGLRPGARAEAELVAERAAALELPWHLLQVDVAGARRRAGGSLQEAARRVRLAALAELAQRRGAARVALAHQADDQAETVLFRIIRGTGLGGLRGIPYRRDPFVRPLLDVSRAAVLRYLGRRSIPFAEDPSNADLRFARARIRHRILPLLAAENPRVQEALVGLAAAAAEAAAGAAAPLADEPAGFDVGRRAAEVIARLRAGRGGTRQVDVRGRRVVEVAYGQVRIRPRAARQARGAPAQVVGDGAAAAPGAATPSTPVAVTGPGAYPWLDGAALLVSATDVAAGAAAAGAPSVEAGAAAFDAGALAWPLALRARRPGDRMRPRGGRGSRKLSDLLIDAKIARDRRAGLPVLTTADGVVLYVPGLRPAEIGRPTSTTTRLIVVRVESSRSSRSV